MDRNSPCIQGGNTRRSDDKVTFMCLSSKLSQKGGFPGAGFSCQEKMTVCAVDKAGSHFQLCCLINAHKRRIPDATEPQFKQKAPVICGNNLLFL
jgi:hypothetical protein